MKSLKKFDFKVFDTIFKTVLAVGKTASGRTPVNILMDLSYVTVSLMKFLKMTWLVI